MKKIAMTMALLVLVLSLAACGGDLTTDTPGKLSNVTPETTNGAANSEDVALEETNSEDEAAHTHNYSEVVLQEPSCTEEGAKEFTCDGCDERYSESIPAMGHDAGLADCTEPATCYTCGQVVQEALGHTGEDGICELCGAPIVEEPATPDSSDTTEETTEPTEGTEPTE